MKKRKACETLAADMQIRQKGKRGVWKRIRWRDKRCEKGPWKLYLRPRRGIKKIDQDGPKRKVRKGGDTALAFFGRKGRKKKRELKGREQQIEREHLEMEKEKKQTNLCNNRMIC